MVYCRCTCKAASRSSNVCAARRYILKPAKLTRRANNWADGPQVKLRSHCPRTTAGPALRRMVQVLSLDSPQRCACCRMLNKGGTQHHTSLSSAPQQHTLSSVLQHTVCCSADNRRHEVTENHTHTSRHVTSDACLTNATTAWTVQPCCCAARAAACHAARAISTPPSNHTTA
jgi:hypothetical protein